MLDLMDNVSSFVFHWRPNENWSSGALPFLSSERFTGPKSTIPGRTSDIGKACNISLSFALILHRRML